MLHAAPILNARIYLTIVDYFTDVVGQGSGYEITGSLYQQRYPCGFIPWSWFLSALRHDKTIADAAEQLIRYCIHPSRSAAGFSAMSTSS
jgi:hypothetical protein